MSERETEAMLTKLRRTGQSGALDGLEIEVWRGGGQPPPYRRSDQFRALAAEGRTVLEFAHPKPDPRFDPPELVERFRLVAHPDDIRRLARLVVESGAFSRELAQETPGGFDRLATEVTITEEGRSFTKRYDGAPPDALAPLLGAIDGFIAQLQKDGERALLHEGRVVPDEAPKP